MAKRKEDKIRTGIKSVGNVRRRLRGKKKPILYKKEVLIIRAAFRSLVESRERGTPWVLMLHKSDGAEHDLQSAELISGILTMFPESIWLRKSSTFEHLAGIDALVQQLPLGSECDAKQQVDLYDVIRRCVAIVLLSGGRQHVKFDSGTKVAALRWRGVMTKAAERDTSTDEKAGLASSLEETNSHETNVEEVIDFAEVHITDVGRWADELDVDGGEVSDGPEQSQQDEDFALATGPTLDTAALDEFLAEEDEELEARRERNVARVEALCELYSGKYPPDGFDNQALATKLTQAARAAGRAFRCFGDCGAAGPCELPPATSIDFNGGRFRFVHRQRDGLEKHRFRLDGGASIRTGRLQIPPLELVDRPD